MPADDQGRIDPEALAAALAAGPQGPAIVVLQAGNVHSGARGYGHARDYLIRDAAGVRSSSFPNCPEVTRRVLADGTAWMSGSRWPGKSVLRISECNWSTTDDDVNRSLESLRRAAKLRARSG